MDIFDTADYILRVIDQLFNISIVIDSITSLITGIYNVIYEMIYEILNIITYIPLKIINLVLMPLVLINERLIVMANLKNEIDRITNDLINTTFQAAFGSEWLVIIYIGLAISLIMLLLKLIKKIPML